MSIDRRIRELLDNQQESSGNYRVVQVQPNLQQPQWYEFAGNETGIVDQISLFLALHSLLTRGAGLDLNEWAEKFEWSFPELAGRNQAAFDGLPWGKPTEERPRIRFIGDDKQRREDGYRVVEFYPNRANPDDVHLLSGTDAEIRQAIQVLFALTRIEREGINFVGYPIDEYLRIKPRDYISIQIWWTTPPEAAYKSRRSVTIPDVSLANLSFETVLQAAGGSNGLNWGNWQARAYLGQAEAKAISQMVASGGSEQEAQANLRQLLPLSGFEALRLSVSHVDHSTAKNPPPPSKRPPERFKVKPAWFTILNSRLVAADDSAGGRGTLSGVLLNRKNKIRLDKPKPEDYDERIAALLRRSS
ncbi:MAG: hypothetical protein HC925_00105 [Coleofasciculaceae cyanobacterium SM2_3_26]|nr:hypothetical protein [Coleofasciculaceae cyanobacterium SM2_3_26]